MARSDPFLEQFHNYCGLIKIVRCGFLWEKTTKRLIASVYTNCETALGRYGPVGDAIDLHFHAGCYHASCDRSAGGLVGSENFGIHLIHGAEVFGIAQEYGAFDNILQIRAATSEDGLHMLQHEPGLLLHGSLRLHLAGRGIYWTLTGDKQKITCAHCA
jgi:hypothetical protein